MHSIDCASFIVTQAGLLAGSQIYIPAGAINNSGLPLHSIKIIYSVLCLKQSKIAGSVHWNWKICGIGTRRKPTTTIRSEQQNCVTHCHYFCCNTCTNMRWHKQNTGDYQSTRKIQNPINTSQNQQKIKLAANCDYNIKYRMRIAEIFIQARQRSTRDQSRDISIGFSTSSLVFACSSYMASQLQWRCGAVLEFLFAMVAQKWLLLHGIT